MANRRRSAFTRTLVACLVFAAAWFVRPINAEAQARGTLQVTAQVIDTKPSSDGLQAARVAVQHGTMGARASRLDTVQTLAQISVAQPSQGRSDLVVTIDYSKN